MVLNSTGEKLHGRGARPAPRMRTVPTDPRSWSRIVEQPKPIPRTRGSRPAFTRRPDRGWVSSYRIKLIVTDVAIVSAMVVASQAIRFAGSSRLVVGGVGPVNYWLVSAVLIVAWLGALGINGAWDHKVLGAGPSEYRRIIQASMYLFGFVAIAAYLLHVEIARGYLAMALPLGLAGLIAGRWVWRRLLSEYRRAGTHMNRVVVIGGHLTAATLATRLRNQPSAGYRVSGLCVPGPDDRGEGDPEEIDGFPIIGTLDDVFAAIARSDADTVAVAASDRFGPDHVRALAWQLEGTGIRLVLAPALTDVAGPRIHVKPVAGLPLMHVEEPRFTGPKLVAKTALDFVVATLAVVLLSPVLLGAAIAIKAGDGGPVFFRQERVGLAGKRFKVWKFRSMTHKADKLAAQAKDDAGQGSSVFYKSADDARITKVGRLIRKTSIDEIPQLFNVLAAQMSLVGPRPLLPGEGAEIGNFVERRMLVRPGITGLWQVSGRSDVTAEERIRLDFYYVENWSVASDLLILVKTVKTVLTKEGAY